MKRRPSISLYEAIRVLGGGWVIDADVEQFFDTVDRRSMQEIVGNRVRDGVVGRLIGKWLRAGVMEAGQVSYPEAGTPQGGVVSPLLSNIYLHEVLDQWWESTVQPRLHGRSFLIRFADDFVLVLELMADAAAGDEDRCGSSPDLDPLSSDLIPIRKPDGPPDGEASIPS